MLSDLSMNDISAIESRIDAIRSRVSAIRERMTDDGLDSFAANSRMFENALSNAEKCSLRIQQSYERRLLESGD